MDLINIDQITRTKTTVDGSERMVGRDGTGDFKIIIADLLKYQSLKDFPIGSIQPVDPSYLTFAGSSFTLPDHSVWCDGAVINDIDSPYNGRRAYNMNGAAVVLTLTWTADALGAYAVVDDADIYGLNVGDLVTGAGIAAGARVKDITITTGDSSVVTIDDTAASGSKSTTFTGRKIFVAGGAVPGASGWNQMQGWQLGSIADSSNVRNYWAFAALRDRNVLAESLVDHAVMTLNTGAKGVPYMLKAMDDGTNGTPRIGADTIPDHRVFKFIMRIK